MSFLDQMPRLPLAPNTLTVAAKLLWTTATAARMPGAGIAAR